MRSSCGAFAPLEVEFPKARTVGVNDSSAATRFEVVEQMLPPHQPQLRDELVLRIARGEREILLDLCRNLPLEEGDVIVFLRDNNTPKQAPNATNLNR